MVIPGNDTNQALQTFAKSSDCTSMAAILASIKLATTKRWVIATIVIAILGVMYTQLALTAR